jgi:hypothetical protein
MQEQIITVLGFYGRLGRPLTALEIWRRSAGENPGSIGAVHAALDQLLAEKKISQLRGFFWITDAPESADAHAYVMRRVFQDVRTDGKWKKFVALRRLFRFIPFVEFVFASGSMAVGNAGPLSDFDVLIGARQGRIFTVRALCIALFGIAGKRRRKLSHHDEANNKICLNHFVTRPAYRLSDPHNMYWEQLYKCLVPLYGRTDEARRFVDDNSWAHGTLPVDRRFFSGPSALARIGEWLLGSGLGNGVEHWLRWFQRRRIETSLAADRGRGYKPRIKYDDTELEFHPDTLRIEKMTGLS